MKRFLGLLLLVFISLSLTGTGNAASEPVKRQIGLIKYDQSKAFKGYTLFAPKHFTTIHLIDMEGHVINTWKSQFEPGQAVYLRENGNLLHCCWQQAKIKIGGGEGGRVEEFDWDGNLVWQWELNDEKNFAHHDIKELPNGNLLVMAVEYKTREECIAAGFLPEAVKKDGLAVDYVLELAKTGASGGKVVWEWHIWDHLVQGNLPAGGNYGVVKDHPELINCGSKFISPFWNHANSIAYNADLKQIVLSARGQNEIYVFEHTVDYNDPKAGIAIAASHKGGKYGRGGDILYRWGNPYMYNRGDFKADRRLFNQHDAQWVPKGYPGEGNMTIFNNGEGGQGYSSVEEIVLPIDKEGNYKIETDAAFAPKEAVWRYYNEQDPKAMYSTDIAGAHRLPNGNTLICNGVDGQFLEVTKEKEVVWEYVNPITTKALKQGEEIPRDARSHPLNAVFKIHRYEPSYPAFKGKDMKPIEDSLVAK